MAAPHTNDCLRVKLEIAKNSCCSSIFVILDTLVLLFFLQVFYFVLVFMCMHLFVSYVQLRSPEEGNRCSGGEVSGGFKPP